MKVQAVTATAKAGAMTAVNVVATVAQSAVASAVVSAKAHKPAAIKCLPSN